METKAIQIQWTAANEGEARRVAEELVTNRLVACASFAPIESLFFWQGGLTHANEIKVFFKTLDHHWETIQKIIVERCEYQTPEILKLPILDGYGPYLKWLEECTRY